MRWRLLLLLNCLFVGAWDICEDLGVIVMMGWSEGTAKNRGMLFSYLVLLVACFFLCDFCSLCRQTPRIEILYFLLLLCPWVEIDVWY